MHRAWGRSSSDHPEWRSSCLPLRVHRREAPCASTGERPPARPQERGSLQREPLEKLCGCPREEGSFSCPTRPGWSPPPGRNSRVPLSLLPCLWWRSSWGAGRGGGGERGESSRVNPTLFLKALQLPATALGLECREQPYLWMKLKVSHSKCYFRAVFWVMMGLSVPKNEQELLTVSIQGEGRLPSEYILFFILFFELNIYLFNFGCIGS